MKNEKIIKTLYHFSKLYRFKNKIEVKSDNYNPFFIIGSGRNGSTLLSSMLNNHSEIFVPLENYVLPYAIIKYSLYNFMTWADISKLIIADFDDPTKTEHWNLSMKKLYPQIRSISKNERSLKRLINEINLYYAKEKNLSNKTFWGDKSPHNIRMIEFIYSVYPNSKYIFLLRDGRAVCNSLLQGKEEIFANYTTIEGATSLWNLSIKKYEWLKKRIKPENILLIKYEDLVENQSKTTEKALNFLGFNNENLESNRTENFESLGFNLSAHHINTSKPVSNEFRDKWKTELTEQQLTQIMQHIGENLKKYNYIN